MAALARTPVLPEAILVGALTALLRHSSQRLPMTALAPLQTFLHRLMRGPRRFQAPCPLALRKLAPSVTPSTAPPSHLFCLCAGGPPRSGRRQGQAAVLPGEVDAIPFEADIKDASLANVRNDLLALGRSFRQMGQGLVAGAVSRALALVRRSASLPTPASAARRILSV